MIQPISDEKNDCILECLNSCHEYTCCGISKNDENLRLRNKSQLDEINNI